MLLQCHRYLSRSRTRHARGGLACLLREPCLVTCSTFSYAASCTPWHGAMFTGCTCPAAYCGPEPLQGAAGSGPWSGVTVLPFCELLLPLPSYNQQRVVGKNALHVPRFIPFVQLPEPEEIFLSPGGGGEIKPTLLEQLPIRSAHLLRVMKLRKPCGDYS